MVCGPNFILKHNVVQVGNCKILILDKALIYDYYYETANKIKL
jgi:hypothetical protein